ncbi:MAG: DUF1186 domain-containing protein [Leptothrix sp. (in: Bacteria)]|jgi:hypothetical protein|nr:DUF1186 domain-containing protein [Leptothrix sp. (in: b-proteobacteria)]
MNATTNRDPDWVEPGAETSPIDDPWQRLCRELGACKPPYPAETVRWALEQREALTPHFLALLERVARDPAAASEEDGDLFNWAYVYLAVWRDQRAWEPLLTLLRQPTQAIDELLGDMVHECYGRALASVCPGDVAALRTLALDESLSVWNRIAVLDAWRLRVQLADAPLAELEDVLLTLGERCAAEMLSATEAGQGHDEAILLADVVCAAGKLQSQRLQPAICGWFDEELVDPMTIRRDTYERDMRRGPAQPEVGDVDRHDRFIDDPVAETRWWGCWSERSKASLQSTQPWPQPVPRPSPAPLSRVEAPAPATYVRTEQKVGRNDPCPCGSGKKYKKCHGAG